MLLSGTDSPPHFWSHAQTSGSSNGPRTQASLLLSSKFGQHSACLGRNKVLTPLNSDVTLLCSKSWDQSFETTGFDHTLCRQPNVPGSDGFVYAQESSQKAISQDQHRISIVNIYSPSSHFNAIDHLLEATCPASLIYICVCSLYSETC